MLQPDLLIDVQGKKVPLAVGEVWTRCRDLCQHKEQALTNLYLELRYGNNNCRFHETSPFSVLRRSSILISWGRRFLMNCGSFGQLMAILVHTSMRLKESFRFSFSAGEYENIGGSCLKGN